MNDFFKSNSNGGSFILPQHLFIAGFFPLIALRKIEAFL